MINDALSFFTAQADAIKGWEKENKNVLINKYIEYENTKLADNYLAAIICKYWHKIYHYYSNNNTFDLDVYLSLVIDGILKALKHRPWLDTTKAISKDSKGPDKTVNRCIKTVVLNYYYLANMDKRKTNINTLRIDGEFGLVDFLNKTEYADMSYESENINACNNIIQHYIDIGDMVSAVVLDNICFQDSVRNNKINIRSVCDNLLNLNDNYSDYFKKSYENVDTDKLKNTFNYFKQLVSNNSNRKVCNCITKTLTKLKNNDTLVSLLCS